MDTLNNSGQIELSRMKEYIKYIVKIKYFNSVVGCLEEENKRKEYKKKLLQSQINIQGKLYNANFLKDLISSSRSKKSEKG